jgi:predicted ATPase
LQIASVIRKKFSFSLLTQVVHTPEEELYPLLSCLQAAEFFYEQPAFPEPEYTFKHALTREVAYNSLLQDRRRVLHERAAQAIEARHGDRLEDHYSELAHHYSRSGNTQKALVYLQYAGQQALQRSAHAEALDHLTAALERLEALPYAPDRIQQELVLRITLGEALIVTKGHTAPDVEQAFSRALELCQQVDDMPQRFRALSGLWRFYFLRRDFQTARELAESAMHLAQRAQHPPSLMMAHLAQGLSLCALGDWIGAQTHVEQSITRYDAQQPTPDLAYALLYGQDPKVTCLCYAALALWCLGYPDQALQRVYQAFTLAHELSHPFSLAFAMYFVALIHRLRREVQAVQERAEAVIALAEAHGFPFWATVGTMLHGWALVEQGQATVGIEQIRRALASYRATGAELEQSTILLIDACAHAGLAEEGLDLLTETLAQAHKAGDLFGEVELYRLRGELLLRQAAGTGFKPALIGTPIVATDNLGVTRRSPLLNEAEACFRQAFDIARRQRGKSLALRAALSPGRLWQQLGKHGDARLLLAEIYGEFTEGFDTADLQQAKTLLEQL